MTDIPVLFSAPMVRALLEGRKTMTRRLAWDIARIGPEFPGKPSRWQRVKPGDRLWVRESLDLRGDRPDLPIWQASYRADGAPLDLSVPANLAFAEGKADQRRGRFINSIHMPRSFSRLTLIVDAVKIERLQDISEDDAKAEGCSLYVPGHGFIEVNDLSEGFSNYLDPIGGFQNIWADLRCSESWNANPEVVAISFRVIKSNR